MLNWKVLTLAHFIKLLFLLPKRWLYICFFVTLNLVLDKIVVNVNDKKSIDIEFDIEEILNLIGINICKPKSYILKNKPVF